MNTYPQGQTVKFTCAFKDLAGSPVDPTTVTLKTRSPAGDVTTYTLLAGQVTREGLGVFSIALALTVPGVWDYRWEGTGLGAGVVERRLQINESHFD